MRQTAAAFTALVLLCYPCPSWSQDSTATLIAVCDQAAAAPLDQSRPTGVVGLLLEKIDPAIAIPACDAAAKAAPNDPRIAFQLGRAYLAAKDYESARAHFEFAADQGDARGQNGLGLLYATGRGGLAKDDREAARLYKLAADQGHANGQFNLGFFYVTGRGGLYRGEFGTQHDVAEHRRSRLRCVGTTTRLQLVHREAHHVGRARQIHPAHV